MALPVLAALTPPGADIHLVDENVEQVDLNEQADLVAISCMTASAPRAYEIADHFRSRSVPVVMGGMHVSAMPAEAGAHADSVVVGEAETLWPQVLADFAAGHPQRLYSNAENRPQLDNLPVPRRDLLRADRYLTTNLVQTARGCPHACSFCSVTPVFGRRYRFRPVAEVVAEIRSLRTSWVGFPDDNIVANPARARELFEALLPLKIRWIGQGDLSMAKDPELLSLMARSGCVAMFIGIETLSPQGLAATNKRPNIGVDLEQAIRAIHRHGIDIVGSFVFGLDTDDPAVFAKTVAFAKRVKLGAAQFAVLTPFPGTALRDQLVDEDRVTSQDWSLYTMGHVVYRPGQMSAQQLQQGRAEAYRQFYSLPSIARRTLVGRGGWRRWGPRMGANMSYRRMGEGGKLSSRAVH